MITRPNAKINLGLNVVDVKANGYHDIETVFYPVPIFDSIDIQEIKSDKTASGNAELEISGTKINCKPEKNLIIQAYNIISADYKLPAVHIKLDKKIPMQAGMGGGSADCAFTITLLNRMFALNMDKDKMRNYAAKLGADCAFFIDPQPCYADGIGDRLSPIDFSMKGLYIAIVKPDVAVSTAEAYKAIRPVHPIKNCRDIIRQPMNTWRKELTNDFEFPIFKNHPEIGKIKSRLYDEGALFAMMSGSGSAVFGIFNEMPLNIKEHFNDCFTAVAKL